jgi:hypothetical protein
MGRDYDDDYDYDDYDDYDHRYDRKGGGGGGLPIVVIVVLALVVVGGIGLAFLRYTGGISARGYGNEAAAIGALKAISTAQVLYREADKDKNGSLDYSNDLTSLGRHDLIDSVLASGTKQGYTFQLQAGPQVEFQWFATADPVTPGLSGARYFYADQSGVIYYSTEGPIQGPLDFKKMPPGVLPVGR